MSGDDLTISLFFGAAGIAFVIPAVQEHGWKRWLFASAGAISFGCAISWPWIKPLFPPVSAGLSQTAANPVSWFCIVMFGLTAVMFYRPSGTRAKHRVLQAHAKTVPNAVAPEISLAAVWAKVDPISLYNAACLWVGEDPSDQLGQVLTGAEGGMLMRLQQAHVDELITAKRPYGPDIDFKIDGKRYISGGDYVASRDELIALANRWGERPPFLFPDDR